MLTCDETSQDSMSTVTVARPSAVDVEVVKAGPSKNAVALQPDVQSGERICPIPCDVCQY